MHLSDSLQAKLLRLFGLGTVHLTRVMIKPQLSEVREFPDDPAATACLGLRQVGHRVA